MTKYPEGGQPGVVEKPIEFRMRFDDILDRAARDVRDGEVDVERRIGPYITVSRTYGSGGAQVARTVADRLGWSLLDKELASELADQLKVSKSTMALLDETRSNWFRDTLLNLMEPRLAIEDNYLSLLTRVICLAGYEGRVVVVGRGGNFVLPREHGLAVRLIASDAFRVNQLQEREGLDADTAERRAREVDEERSDFIRRHFDRDVAAASGYDMVLDVSALGLEGSADLVCRAVELRQLAADE